MSKILKYELRRLILNKFFIGLLIINGAYAWYILTNDIIAGIAYTAPFSPWSFGAYLAKVMPIAILTVLFLLTFYYSKKEKQVEALTTATSVNPVSYVLTRCLAISICFLIICCMIFGLGIYFYISILDYWGFSVFILPALIVLLPCFAFALGIGNLVGRIHEGLLYILMLIALIVGFGGSSSIFDFFGSGYFSSHPISLPVSAGGEPVFIVETDFFIVRFIYLIIGVTLLTIGVKSSYKKANKA